MMMMLLFAIATIVGMSVIAAASLQHVDAISNYKTVSCRNHLSDSSKCSQQDTPFILPFP